MNLATMMSTCIPLFWFIFFSINIGLFSEGCIEDERDALLQFKNGLIDPSNRLADWVPHALDCCTWTGVVCHNITSNVVELHLRTLSLQEYLDPDKLVIADKEYKEYEEYYRKSAMGGKVSSSLLHLKHLSYLDLSFNDFGGVLAVPEFIGSMQSLRCLNFSEAGFGGIIPPQLGNLSNLNYLNLRSNYAYDHYLHVENLDWITSLSSLEFLDLSFVDVRSLEWLKVLNSVPSLVELHLSYCSLPSFIPSSLPSLNFSSLVVLDLSGNFFAGPISNGLQNMSSFLKELDLSSSHFNSSIPDWLFDLTNLQLLDLGGNYLQGQISSNIGNLTSLISLDLSYNYDLNFEKGIPCSFQNLNNLRLLSLSGIKMKQEINDVLSIISSSVLQSLRLNECELFGHLTDNLTRFKNLVTFDMSDNLITGPIPLSFGNLNKLEDVPMSNNKLEGEVSQLHFANLTRLVFFIAPGMTKNIALRVNYNWIPPLNLQTLELGSWKIGPQFPKWLRLLRHLTRLDLSNSEISTPFPVWFWDLLPNYNYLDLLHNQMHGSIPNIPFANRQLPMIYLSSNNFSGQVPRFSSNITALDLSHNSFSGSIFDFLCYNMNEKKKMAILNLEGNLLHGEIPDCWESWSNLAAITLRNNFFSGNIPNSIGTIHYLLSLQLGNNNLSGQVPSSFRNCTALNLLDISENNLDGKISTWIRNELLLLRILNLRANKFDGNLPKDLCYLVSLQILDLSHNNFFGTIPTCFSNFTRMANRIDSPGSVINYNASHGEFMESALLLIKGKVREYSTNLGFVRSIDLSNNDLWGEIPREITSLAELVSLNLSRNGLIGRIPNTIGNMKGLNAIDFSYNKLSGEIPQSMSNLSFLGTLDLSYNNLSGRIPTGTQLQSFNSSSFMGNHLCGLPLTNNCTLSNPKSDPATKEDDDSEDEYWFYASVAFGFIFGFWSVVCSLVFITNWRKFYFRSLYKLRDIIMYNLIGRVFKI